jgi:hypothetical protein
MLTERDIDLMQVEIEAYMERLIMEYAAMWLGDRGDIGNGDIYDQEGRYPVQDSGEVRGIIEPIA